MATRPEVILLDEPCSALDPISTAKIEELIDELSNEYTIVIVTHNMQQASRISDYTAFMYLGELIEFGTDGENLHRADEQADRSNTSPAGLADSFRRSRLTAVASLRAACASTALKTTAQYHADHEIERQRR